MIYKPRYLTKFTKSDNTESLVFPRGEHERESSQPFRLSNKSAIGANYGIDLLGNTYAPKGNGSERVRFVLVGTPAEIDIEWDRMTRKCQEFSMGKLFSSDYLGNERWAWARATDMPDLSSGVKDAETLPVSIGFSRYSDWHNVGLVTDVRTVVVNSDTYNLENAGNSTVYNMTIIIQSLAAGGFDNPVVTNLATGEWFWITRTALSSNDLLKIDTGKMTVQYSNDGGVSYTSDYTNLVMGPVQAGIMRLLDGTNQVKVESAGTVNMEVTFQYYPTNH